MPRARTESSTVRRIRHADSIVRRGFDMSASPCGSCRSRNVRCVLDPKSGRCAECIGHHRQCDKVLDWKRVEKLERLENDLQAQFEAADAEGLALLEEEERLYVRRREDEERRRAETSRLVEQHRTVRGRKKRLAKQLSLLRNRRDDLLAKDLENIEELELLEARENSPTPSGPSQLSPSAFLDSDSLVDLDFWMPPETVPVSQRIP